MYPFMRQLSITYRCAMRYREHHLLDTGLAGCQTQYLIALYNKPGMTQEELARFLNVNKSSVARQLPALEAKGYVMREPDPDDKRVFRVYPTEKAMELQERMYDVLEAWSTYLTQGFSDDERKTLSRLMGRIAYRAESYTKGGGDNCKSSSDT